MNKKIMLIVSVCLTLVVGSLAVGHASEKRLLGESHVQNGVSCEDCHADDKTIAPQSSACINCHGSIEEMAKITKKTVKTSDIYAAGHLYLENINPHEHHLGDIDCFSCHTVHKELQQENSPCYECHTFKLKMP